ncbi:hypothetical protein [Nocardiopsis sp. NRRL B-16309]|uniref:hypothetical protein n=1 Tax=Nocardiopsis sp. NRRL B-16309 TaxID=1519494 RepID=UPI0006B032A3|nr:hypothetical protein [Nocardiopsis sp. NRRL B-16309]
MPDAEAPVTDPDECGLTDVSCRLTVGFYLWVVGLIADLINTTITALVTPALFTPPPTAGIEEAWSTSRTVANALFPLVVVAAGVLLMSYQTVQSSTAVKDLLPRLVLGFVGANASWLLTDMVRELGNGIALSMFDGAATVENLTRTLTRVLSNPIGELLTVVLMMLVAALLWFFFVLAIWIRIILWFLLTAVAPLALACHALPQADGLARMWWRAVAALILVQIGQALVMRIMVAVFLNRDSGLTPEGAGSIFDVLLLIACLYVLIRIPFWAFKRVFNYQASPIVSAAKFAVSLVVFRNIGKALSSRQGAQSATRVAATRSAQPRPTPSAPTSPAPARPARWTQPELPDFSARLPYRQDPLPGIDRHIDRRSQARLRERRRYYQPEFPRPRQCPAPQRQQDPLPHWREPAWRQEPLPGARHIPAPRPRPQQDALFDPPRNRRRRRP